MRSPTPALLCFACVASAACGSRQTPSEAHSGTVPPGLYQVTSRVCESPPAETQACSLLQYVEIAKDVELANGSSSGATKDQAAFILWYAPAQTASNYTYESWPLRGRFVDPSQYVVHEFDESKEALVIEQGAIREFQVIRFRNPQRTDISFQRRFFLQRVPRSPDLDKQLRLQESSGEKGPEAADGAR
jgi:hypothetical protein